jgi:hypothetical protein
VQIDCSFSNGRKLGLGGILAIGIGTIIAIISESPIHYKNKLQHVDLLLECGR